ncbi:MAG: hypothetical protein U0Q18_18555 [Bryobacteraceae bacterium]
MSGPDGRLLALLSLGIIVPARVYVLARQLWTFPLRNGPGYFLGVEVPPLFYDGPGVRWLKRYRTVLVFEHSAEALFLLGILALGRWEWIPLTALGAATFTAAMFGFFLYTRRNLGGHPPAQTAVGLVLETRRIRDYISWPVEALVFAIVASSWFLLVTHGDAEVQLHQAIVDTWVVLGLLPGKLVLVRSSFPVPADRAEEHYRLQDAQRRFALRVFDALGWFWTAVLFVYALRHSWPATQAGTPLNWLFTSIVIGLGLYMTFVVIRGQDRLIAMGRDLRPAGSWSAPFRGAQWMSRPGLAWFACWFGGIVVLLTFLRS